MNYLATCIFFPFNSVMNGFHLITWALDTIRKCLFTPITLMLLLFWWAYLAHVILKWKFHACKYFRILILLSFTDCLSISTAVCVGTCGPEEFTFLFMPYEMERNRKIIHQMDWKEIEMQWICAKQNNNKDEEIWLQNGHLNLFQVLSFLVCHLASLHQPFGFWFYAQ